ncbi:Hypothetical protein CINCED_3A009097 [Cinara cedri]|uniref:Uncharacterized protein n=1 Tax=Cinara cedri TaxID=506608 RepID=A0A5E4N089_9HEMI|nr:Hypothetical protein CINCED_3A009097 [Cinara cedri]
MEEFGFPKKLINLTKFCMEVVKYRVSVDGIESEAFSVETRLKQGDAHNTVPIIVQFGPRNGGTSIASLEKNKRPSYRYEDRPVAYKAQPRTARGIKNGNNKWGHTKPKILMARIWNAA